MEGNTANWPDEDFVEATVDTNVSMSMMAEEVPTMTVATIVGVTAVMLIAIVIVFLLGVFVDCRQQRLIDEQKGEVKRLKNQRRVNTRPDDDSACIASNMEESSMSSPPVAILTEVTIDRH